MKFKFILIFTVFLSMHLASYGASENCLSGQIKDNSVIFEYIDGEILWASDTPEEDLRVMLQQWLDNDGIFKHAPELTKLMAKVNDLANKQGSEVGYFDWDVWQETQDMPGKEIVNKVAMLTENTAVASVTIDFGYYKTERSVILSKESGKWKIVDFVTSSGKSFKITCEDALEELENN